MAISYRLSQVVRQYCLMTYNDARKHYVNHLTAAKWVWVDMFKGTLQSVKTVWVGPVAKGGKMFIPKPVDMLRFIAVSVTDECGKLRDILCDETMNTLVVPVSHKSCCQICGQVDELSACMGDFTLSTRPVVIRGEEFTERVWKEVCKNGDIQEITETPVQDFDASNIRPDSEQFPNQQSASFTIKWVANRRTIANVELKACGCIIDSGENRETIASCGGVINTNKSVRILSKPYQKYGTHKLMPEGIYLEGDVPDWVQMTYQADAEGSGEEIMVPEYAVLCVLRGIKSFGSSFSPMANPSMRDADKRDYHQEKDSVLYHLNTISVDAFMLNQGNFPMWGHAGDGLSSLNDLPFG